MVARVGPQNFTLLVPIQVQNKARMSSTFPDPGELVRHLCLLIDVDCVIARSNCYVLSTRRAFDGLQSLHAVSVLGEKFTAHGVKHQPFATQSSTDHKLAVG